MVVQFKAISKITSGQMEQVFRERAAKLKSAVAERIADDIVDFSPVDTGTYIMAHKAGTGSSDADATRSSAPGGTPKQRGRNPQQFKNLARGNLKRSVSSQAVMNATEIWFANSALHAERVETLGWRKPLFGNPNSPRVDVEPYRVYAQARRRIKTHIADVAASLGMQVR
jgi:hypothetical protein